MTETPDERADRLIRIGLDVADRIRDEDPTAVARTLDSLDRTELRDLVILLGAAVDISAPVSMLFGWWHGRPRRLRPCGTPAAAKRHRARGEELCDECREAQRTWDRGRKRLARAS